MKLLKMRYLRDDQVEVPKRLVISWRSLEHRTDLDWKQRLRNVSTGRVREAPGKDELSQLGGIWYA